jgi:hypothetical protein
MTRNGNCGEKTSFGINAANGRMILKLFLKFHLEIVAIYMYTMRSI